MGPRKKFMRKVFIYFVCFWFLLSISSFPIMDAEAKEISFPIGEMVLGGDVKFELKEKAWRNIESSHFPIFQKGKIKTEKGTGIITLANNCQIEVGPHSILSFDQVDRFHILQGRVNFRIPSGKEVSFTVGSLSVTKSRALQAARTPGLGSSIKNEETIGSVSLHSNGSVTVKSLQGSVSILDQDRVVLAALSTKEAITIPSITASGKARTMVAQVGEIKEERSEEKITGAEEWEYLGLNTFEWIAVGYAAALVGGLIYAFWPKEDKDRAAQVPLCP